MYCLVSVIVQSASHNCPRDNKLAEVKPGRMNDCVADAGRVAIGRLPLCVDAMELLLGKFTCGSVGVEVGLM